MTLGRVNEKKGRKRKTWGGVGSEAVTSGQRPPSAVRVCVCVCVRAYQARKGHEATLPPVRSSWAASPTPRISGENP